MKRGGNVDWKLSYDYADLLEELNSDLEEFGVKTDDYIYIVRGNEVGEENFGIEKTYKPIIDYYLQGDQMEEPTEKITVKKALEEMQTVNQII